VREAAREVVEEVPVAAPTRPGPPPETTWTPEPAPARTPAAAPPAAAPPAAGADLDAIRRRWPDVLVALSGLKRATWSLVSQHADLIGFDGQRLVLGFKAPNLASSFNRGAHQELTRQALIDAAGLDVKVEAVVGNQPPARSTEPARAPGPPPPAARPQRPDERADPQPASRPAQRPEPARPSARPGPAEDDIPLPDEPPPDEPPVPDDGYRRAPEPPPSAPPPSAPPRPSSPRRAAPAAVPSQPSGPTDDDEPSMDDADIEGSHLVGAPVVEQLLGGRVIEEHDA
jgi:DNA polymerase-3 subunit gamma/tau